ncbi:MAG: DegV family protein [Erysipelotrichaceae bacterium]
MEQMITNEALHNAIRCGANNIVKHQSRLNQINVFPVADGDTGNNLASLMYSILDTGLQETTSETLKEVSEAALLGARGNSGIIFAQYFYGMYLACKGEKRLDGAVFAHMLVEAAHYAYRAIEHPVEGTMISVMRVWGNSVQATQAKGHQLKVLIEDALQPLRSELEQTTKKIQVLRQHHVVDSGAQGFVYFVEGFSAALLGEVVPEDLIPLPAIVLEHEVDTKYRYCCECILERERIHADNIKISLKPWVDSLVVATTKTKARVHFHTNDPEQSFAALETYGTVRNPKVDDMLLQMHSMQHPLSDTVILCDSAADLSEKDKERYHIYTLDMHIMINDQTYLDKRTLSTDGYFKRIAKGNVKTSSSAPSNAQMERMLHFLLAYYKHVIVITVSSHMSGCYQALQTIKQQQFKDESITIIDSKKNAVAEGMIVRECAKALASGMSYEETIDFAKRFVEETQILVGVAGHHHLEQGGRVSKQAVSWLKRLHLYPMLGVKADGRGSVKRIAFSRAHVLRTLVRWVKKAKDQEYAIVYTQKNAWIEYAIHRLQSVSNRPPSAIVQSGVGIAMNAGDNAIGVVVFPKRV